MNAEGLAAEHRLAGSEKRIRASAGRNERDFSTGAGYGVRGLSGKCRSIHGLTLDTETLNRDNADHGDAEVVIP